MPDDYNLPRHKTESARLELQHDTYTRNTKYILHPRIAAALPKNARVADVGTGTGIWLRELAARSPTTWTFQGLDVSDAQFPEGGQPAADRIKYAVLNITEDVPEEWQGRFDAVHMRLLVCGLTSPQWAIAARNALRLLKPGGWLQWHEAEFNNFRAVANEPGASVEWNQKLYDALISTLREQQNKMGREVEGLRDIVRDAGFEDVAEDVFSSDRDPEMRKRSGFVQGPVIRSLTLSLAKGPGYPYSVKEAERGVERAEEEMRDGKAYHWFPMRIVTGRKASS